MGGGGGGLVVKGNTVVHVGRFHPSSDIFRVHRLFGGTRGGGCFCLGFPPLPTTKPPPPPPPSSIFPGFGSPKQSRCELGWGGWVKQRKVSK